MKDVPGISILVPTYNRSPVLRETLQRIAATDLSSIDLEIVVIDNNSDDATAQCVAEFKPILPILYLKERRPGKNRALNKALKESKLRDLVVFIDDDISPQANWLKEILAVAYRWPNADVFGAKVQVGWPHGHTPDWIIAEWIKVFGFAWHDLGDVEKVYEREVTPMGPCFWVRKRVFDKVPLFDERLGPAPKNRIMGSEVSFFIRLKESGFNMVYCPQVQVLHRIQDSDCSVSALRRRAYRCGRGEARLYGIHRKQLFEKNQWVWTAAMLGELVLYSGGRFLASLAVPNPAARAELTLRAMVRVGKVYESFRLVWRERP